MPTYRLASQMMRNGQLLPVGATIDLADGPERDRLVELDVIYRPDIGPMAPRGLYGGLVLLPCVSVHSPEFPKKFDSAWAARVGLPADAIARWVAADKEGFSYWTPVDEWAIPANQWPPTGLSFAVHAVQLGPVPGRRFSGGYAWLPFDRSAGPAKLRLIV